MRALSWFCSRHCCWSVSCPHHPCLLLLDLNRGTPRTALTTLLLAGGTWATRASVRSYASKTGPATYEWLSYFRTIRPILSIWRRFVLFVLFARLRDVGITHAGGMMLLMPVTMTPNLLIPSAPGYVPLGRFVTYTKLSENQQISRALCSSNSLRNRFANIWTDSWIRYPETYSNTLHTYSKYNTEFLKYVMIFQDAGFSLGSNAFGVSVLYAPTVLFTIYKERKAHLFDRCAKK